VLTLEAYRGVGKLKGKARGGNCTFSSSRSAGAGAATPVGQAADQPSHPSRTAAQPADVPIQPPMCRCQPDWGHLPPF
jgi:hypothetical protein